MMPSDRTWVEKDTILRCVVGSSVHGVSTGTDDRDEMGVCLEPFPLAYGCSGQFDQYIYRTATERTGKHDEPSQPGDLDLTIYSLRKWVNLALKGNPTVLLLLYAPPSAVVTQDPRGRILRELAPAFVSKRAGKAFMGYLQAQRMRLMGQKAKNVHRQALVDKYGFDTKFAGHMVRLGYQGVEYLETGKLTLPMPEPARTTVVWVREGKYPLDAVHQMTLLLEDRLKDLLDTSTIPDEPDVATVETWMLDTYLEHWKCTWEHEQILKSAKAGFPPRPGRMAAQ
jgi:hypothetical protein